MTTPNTIVDTMAGPSVNAEKAHLSRADRPTSFNLDDIAVCMDEEIYIHPDASHRAPFEPAN